MSQPFFSIVMPVYNSEKYLSKALDSILKQTFTDFELIIVDDGSIDRSYMICKQYAVKDARIILKQTMSRSGISNVRNEGLKWVSGKYLTFIDSDDFIDNDLLEVVYKKLLNNIVHVLKYGYIEEYYTSEGRFLGNKKFPLPPQYMTRRVEIRKYILEMEQIPLFGYLWNSFYNVQALKIKENKFDLTYEVNEDFMFNLNVFDSVKSLYCLNKCGYHYTKRENNSLSTRMNNKYYLFHMKKINKLLEKYKKWCLLDDEVLENIFWLYTRYIYSTIIRNMNENMGQNNFLLLNKIFESKLFSQYQTIKFSNISFKQKLLVNTLKNKNKLLIIVMCDCMKFIKKRFSLLFAYLKE